jgi:hypothetical protein
MRIQKNNHGRPRDENTLDVPEWLKVEKYAALEKFGTAQLWLEQFAIRIDLLAFINEVFARKEKLHDGIAPDGVNREYPDDRSLEWVLDESFALLEDNPILPVESLIRKYRSLEREFDISLFDNAWVAVCGLDRIVSVRHMTPMDFMMVNALFRESERTRMDAFFDRISCTVPFPFEQLEQAGKIVLTDRVKVAEDYRTRLLSEIGVRRRWDPTIESRYKPDLNANSDTFQSFFHGFMDCQLAESLLTDDVAYFIVDANSSAEKAAEEFKQHLKAIQKEKKDSNIDETAFKDWRAMRVLPYVDLQLYDAIEQKRRGNARMRIAPKELGIALFGCEDARFENLPGKASVLGNPNSKIYRSLLHAAKAELVAKCSIQHNKKPIRKSKRKPENAL